MSDSPTIRNHAAFIWSVADLLRGDYKQSEYGKVILPLVVLRRLDCVLDATKAQVLAKHKSLAGKIENIEPVLQAAAGQQFFNTSPLDFKRLLDDPTNLADNVRAYIAAFSLAARDVIEKFDLATQIAKLDRANLLFLVISKFADIDLHTDAVSNIEMGYLYEELIRRFSELSNETAGEHFTPREVVRLMVNLLFIEDENVLTKPGTVRTLLDPACGTGGMLSVAEDHLRQLNPAARLEVFGQELNAETFAICRSDLMLKGQDASHIVLGNSFSEDGHADSKFDYLLANPPFGVEWKKVEGVVKTEAETKGLAGRFGAGTPRINDGSFLFLQHMVSKMKPAEEGGSRLAIVFNGSPLFTGAAGSGESEIRRWIIENDWLEAVVALPDSLFYNTAISTYFWIVTNRKSKQRRGKVQLIDARESFVKMRRSLGEKRKEISADQIEEITRRYGDFTENDNVKIFPNETFGYLRVTVERPLRVRWRITDDALVALEKSKPWRKWAEGPGSRFTASGVYGADGSLGHWGQTWDNADDMQNALCENMGGGVPIEIIRELIKLCATSDPDGVLQFDKKGNPLPDPDVRDNENVALPSMPVTWVADPTERLATIEYRNAVEDYLRTEVQPYVRDAWADHDKTRIGYEIPLTRHFYRYVPPRPLAEIDSEIKALEAEIQRLLAQSVMSTAVGGGSARGGSFRPAECSWLEAVPSHWREVKLTLVSKLGSGHTPSRQHQEWWENPTIPWITTGEVAQMRSDQIEFITETREMISELGMANSSATLHPAGTVVLCRTASAGYSAIMGRAMATSQDFATWTCGPLLRPRFLLLCLRAMRQDLLGRLAMGSTHQTIYMPDIESLRVPLPPLDEQDRIVESAHRGLVALDATVTKLRAQMTLLLEHRHALTLAAVTGGLELQGVAG